MYEEDGGQRESGSQSQSVPSRNLQGSIHMRYHSSLVFTCALLRRLNCSAVGKSGRPMLCHSPYGQSLQRQADSISVGGAAVVVTVEQQQGGLPAVGAALCYRAVDAGENSHCAVSTCGAQNLREDLRLS
ncbi:hypothetical protein F7725_012758 [Dissostichus mawsoni]|uniref:Uncharacterized protein n=1 Tax=Dissostichus mawsoni TaxID=36200 RepID=A0A7J5YN91_DISMA|nr:hypothetical protein F7725_012758 [Dissostichus mawsoni]